MHAIEFHGRLCRAAEPPATPGLYDLLFRLHPERHGESALWEDEVRAIPVSTGGYYHVILGGGNALVPHLFDGSPRYLSVRLLHGNAVLDEAADRVPVLGLVLKVAEAVDHLDGRVAALEAANGRLATARRRVRVLRRRMIRVESGPGGLIALHERVLSLEGRLVRVDGESGRLGRLEDEVEDLVGPDGDVVDLDTRVSRIEGVSTPGDHDRLAMLERRLGEVEARLKRR